MIGIKQPNLHKIMMFFPTTSSKSLHAARIDELADYKRAGKKSDELEVCG